MINKFVKYFFVFTILFIFTITSIIALDSDLRRYLFGRAISAYKLYQIIAIQPYLKSDNIEEIKEFQFNDPIYKAGVWDEITISPFNKRVDNLSNSLN